MAEALERLGEAAKDPVKEARIAEALRGMARITPENQGELYRRLDASSPPSKGLGGDG